jgi:hypothetical protein
MAVFLIEQLRIVENDAEHRGEASLAAACARAIRETFTSLMDPCRPQRSERPTSRTTSGLGAHHSGR